MGVQKHDESLIEMLMESSGMWQISPERVELLRRYLPKISERNRSNLREMLDRAAQGERFWTCSTEYYLVLTEIKSIQSNPSADEIEDVYQLLVDGSREDRVDHREWVRRTIELLGRIKGEQ